MYRPLVTSTATPWRQIIFVRNIEFCNLLKAGSSLPFAQQFIILMREIIPSFFSECPKKVPYRFEAVNINYTDAMDDGTKWWQAPIANGHQKVGLRFWNENDDEILHLEWQMDFQFEKFFNVFN